MPLDEFAARDAIDEVATMFFPRQVRLERIPALRQPLAVLTRDGSRWVLAGDGLGPASAPDALAEAPSAAVRTPCCSCSGAVST